MAKPALSLKASRKLVVTKEEVHVITVGGQFADAVYALADLAMAYLADIDDRASSVPGGERLLTQRRAILNHPVVMTAEGHLSVEEVLKRLDAGRPAEGCHGVKVMLG